MNFYFTDKNYSACQFIICLSCCDLLRYTFPFCFDFVIICYPCSEQSHHMTHDNDGDRGRTELCDIYYYIVYKLRCTTHIDTHTHIWTSTIVCKSECSWQSFNAHKFTSTHFGWTRSHKHMEPCKRTHWKKWFAHVGVAGWTFYFISCFTLGRLVGEMRFFPFEHVEEKKILVKKKCKNDHFL